MYTKTIETLKIKFDEVVNQIKVNDEDWTQVEHEINMYEISGEGSYEQYVINCERTFSLNQIDSELRTKKEKYLKAYLALMELQEVIEQYEG